MTTKTVIGARDVTAVVRERVDSNLRLKDRTRKLEDYDRAVRAEVDSKLKELERLRNERLEREGENADHDFEVTRTGTKETPESRKAYEERETEIQRLKEEHKRVQATKTRAGVFAERANRWVYQNPGPYVDVTLEPKRHEGKSDLHMFGVAVKSLGHWRDMRKEIDQAPLPFPVAARRITADWKRVCEQAKVSTRGAYYLRPDASGNLHQGHLRIQTIRVPGGDGFEFPHPVALIGLMGDEFLERILEQAKKHDRPELALSMKERAAKGAELDAQIRRAEFDAAEWWWLCRHGGLADLEPPNVPIQALLGVTVAAESADLDAGVKAAEAVTDAEVDPDAELDEFDAEDFDAEAVDFG